MGTETTHMSALPGIAAAPPARWAVTHGYSTCIICIAYGEQGVHVSTAYNAAST